MAGDTRRGRTVVVTSGLKQTCYPFVYFFVSVFRFSVDVGGQGWQRGKREGKGESEDCGGAFFFKGSV